MTSPTFDLSSQAVSDPQDARAAWRRPPNPFSSQFVQPAAMGYRFADRSEDVSALCDLWLAPEAASASLIIGPHGTGKSTLLENLCDHITSRGISMQRFSLASGQVPRIYIPPVSAVVVDGFEQLSRLSIMILRRGCQRKNVRLLGTSHRPIRSFTCLHTTGARLDLALQMTHDLLKPCPALRPAANKEVQRLWPSLSGNLRELWFSMYDWYQSQTT